MDPAAAEHPSQPHAVGLADLREIITDALRYWERRRLVYNALLAAIVVVAHVVVGWPAVGAALLDRALNLFVLAVLANVLYCAAYVAHVFLQLSGFRAQRGRWRLALLVAGCAFAAVLTLLVSHLKPLGGPWYHLYAVF
jgi:hypothetical protein